MKRFSFSLEKLLRYKEQVFDVERGILVEMNAVLSRLWQELEDMQGALRKSSVELNEKYSQGITALEISRHKLYLNSLGEDIVSKQMQIELQRQAIDRQMDKVREAKIEISTMEKLKEKKLEEYNYLVQKAEEQFIEEFISNKQSMAASLGS